MDRSPPPPLWTRTTASHNSLCCLSGLSHAGYLWPTGPRVVELVVSGPDSNQKIKNSPASCQTPNNCSRLSSPKPRWQDSPAPDGPEEKKTVISGGELSLDGERRRRGLTLHSNCSPAGSRTILVGGHGAVLGSITHNTPTKRTECSSFYYRDDSERLITHKGSALSGRAAGTTAYKAKKMSQLFIQQPAAWE